MGLRHLLAISLVLACLLAFNPFDYFRGSGKKSDSEYDSEAAASYGTRCLCALDQSA